jgi:hypothetical protein
MLNPINLTLTKLFQWPLDGKPHKFVDEATLSSSKEKGGERYLISLRVFIRDYINPIETKLRKG